MVCIGEIPYATTIFLMTEGVEYLPEATGCQELPASRNLSRYGVFGKNSAASPRGWVGLYLANFRMPLSMRSERQR
jgi:hypothetical protein